MSEIVDQFEALCRAAPDRPLVVVASTRTRISAREIWRQHEDFVECLRQLPLCAGDLIVCAIGNRPELLPFLLASRRLDAVLMPVDTGATDAEVAALCTRFGAKALLTSVAGPLTEATGQIVAPGLTLSRWHGDAVSYAGAALLKITSGSTGLPRGTRTSEAQLVADGRQIMSAMEIGPEDTQLAVIPLAHSYGLGVIVMPLLLQGTGIILRESFVPPQIALDARTFGARRLPGVPFMFEYLIEHSPADGWPRELTGLVSAGAPLSPATVRAFHSRFGVKVHAFYGTTETGGITFDGSADTDAATTVGRPLPGVSVSLEPMAGVEAGLGRVRVRSAAVSDGYVGGDSGGLANGSFLTGDYGRLDDQGRLTLVGRVSSFINVAGRKVQPEEIEAVLRAMPAVADARVIGAPDPHRGEQVVACVVGRPDSAAPPAFEIRQFCSTRLAAHKVPRAIVFLESIPLTARGKTDRVVLDVLVREWLAEAR